MEAVLEVPFTRPKGVGGGHGLGRLKEVFLGCFPRGIFKDGLGVTFGIFWSPIGAKPGVKKSSKSKKHASKNTHQKHTSAKRPKKLPKVGKMESFGSLFGSKNPVGSQEA